MPLTRVAIIGAGGVANALAGRLVAGGKDVCFGVRSVQSDSAKKAQEMFPNAKVITIPEAVDWAEALIICTPGQHKVGAYQSLVDSLGSGVNGKIVFDATNPVSEYPNLEVRWDGSESAGEELARLLPGAHVFKAFNTIGVEHMIHPDGSLISGQRLTMLFAGDPAKEAEATDIIAAVGFDPKYVGPIRFARNLEAIAELWIHMGVPGLKSGAPSLGRNFAFQLDHKK